MDLENWNSIIWIVVLNWKIGTLLYGNLELYCMEFWNSIVWIFVIIPKNIYLFM